VRTNSPCLLPTKRNKLHSLRVNALGDFSDVHHYPTLLQQLLHHQLRLGLANLALPSNVVGDTMPPSVLLAAHQTVESACIDVDGFEGKEARVLVDLVMRALES
jgi:hypothetical protein